VKKISLGLAAKIKDLSLSIATHALQLYGVSNGNCILTFDDYLYSYLLFFGSLNVKRLIGFNQRPDISFF
jgi:hypothetical protein